MITVKQKMVLRVARALGALLFLFTPLLARAQVGPASHGALTIHLFGDYTYGSSDWSSNHSGGVTLGGFVQTPRLFGLELRGSYLGWGVQERRYDAMGGPRVAFHFSRFAPYGDVLGGVGHGITWKTGIDSSFKNGTGFEWQLLGGVDYYATHHLSVRLGEISYVRLSALQNGLSAINLSAGVVYRVPLREH